MRRNKLRDFALATTIVANATFLGCGNDSSPSRPSEDEFVEVRQEFCSFAVGCGVYENDGDCVSEMEELADPATGVGEDCELIYHERNSCILQNGLTCADFEAMKRGSAATCHDQWEEAEFTSCGVAVPGSSSGS